MTEGEACKEAYESIFQHIEGGMELVRHTLSKLKETENCWEFVHLKSELMQQILDLLPIYAGDCPFCLLYLRDEETEEKNCKECPYGKIHGICSQSGYSTYSNLVGKISWLERAIFKYGRVPDDMEEK